MTERLLQYIWQFQYFNRNELRTVCGQELVIIRQGLYNRHQGPDFLEARIRIGKELWAGNVELHIHSSDWLKHSHSGDPNYENVILHVVWKDDADVGDIGLVTLVLEDRVPHLLIQQFENWMKSEQFIPCGNSIKMPEEVIWKCWKERLLVERLQRKSKVIMAWLENNNFHWEEVLWWLVARNFGLTVNADAFEEIARSISYSLLLKNRGQLQRIEALLFGQAGLLENEEEKDDYVAELKREYSFLRKKYKLECIHLPVLFLRMRPACFPTVRLAQLAAVVYHLPQLFSLVTGDGDVRKVKELLNVSGSSYWDHHFVLGEATGYHPKKPGSPMISSILINSIVPILYTYGEHRKEGQFCDKAIEWLGQVKAEKNSITEKFARYGIDCDDAGGSQSLIELKTQYCDQRRCLECAVGAAILNVKRET